MNEKKDKINKININGKTFDVSDNQNELTITLKDTKSSTRHINELQKMLTKIYYIVEKYGFDISKVDFYIDVVLPGTIKDAVIDVKLPPINDDKAKAAHKTEIALGIKG